MALALVFIGSSSVAPGSPLPRFIGSRLGVDATARGRNGARVSQWVEWLQTDDAGVSGELRGRAVVIALGGNEPVSRPPSPADVARVDELVREAGAGAVVWLPPPSYESTATDAGGRPMRGRREAMVAALQAAGVLYVSTEPGVGRAFSRDGVHPTRSGYRRWAEHVAPELGRLVRRSPEGAQNRQKTPLFPVLVGLAASVWALSA